MVFSRRHRVEGLGPLHPVRRVSIAAPLGVTQPVSVQNEDETRVPSGAVDSPVWGRPWGSKETPAGVL